MYRPILLATPLLVLSACGGTPANQPAALPGQTGVQVTPSAPGQPPAQISVNTPDGRAEVRTGVGAAAWPEGLPPYPGATADQSVNVTGASPQGSGRIVGFRTPDPAAQIISFYADAAGRAGYRVLSRMDAGATATLALQRDGGENVAVTATRIGDYTQGQIVVSGARQ